MSMASSSLLPIRRYRSSWRPAFASKCHLSPAFTIGTGNGQSSLPTNRTARFAVLGSTETLFFSRASAAKPAARSRSCGYSPERTMSSPSGPKIASRAPTSNFSAASTRALAACCGVSKLLATTRTEVEAGLEADACAEVVCGAAGIAQAIAPMTHRNLLGVWRAEICFMSQPPQITRKVQTYLRRPPPPPPRKPPPLPREPMLEAPRLLLARVLDPLYPREPREPPPNASRFPPPLRERSRPPMLFGPLLDRLPPPNPPDRLLTLPPPARVLVRLP